MEIKNPRTIAKMLEDRRSTRKFLQDFKVPKEDLDLIVEAARFSPSSYGILNSRLIVIENKDFRKNLIPYFYYQNSFVSASVYLLFIVDKGQFIESKSIFTAKKYIHDDDTFSKYQIDLANIMAAWDDKFNGQTGENIEQWSMAQAYVPMTSAMIQAEQLGLDTTPHEGFNRMMLDKYLRQHKYLGDDETVAIGLAIGKVDNSKRHANNKVKVRKDLKDYVSYIK